MGKACLAVLCGVALGIVAPMVRGNTLYVTGFGVGGWSSWETRDASGTLLIGTTDSSAAAATYFNTPATSAGDTAIQKQIVFMDSGASLKAAGAATILTGPSGSLNDDGYVRLDAANGSSGRADLSYVDFNGIAAASVLDNASFDYHYYMQPYSSIHPLILNITVRGTDGVDYTLSHAEGGTGGWVSASITATNGTFNLTKKGSSTGLDAGKTLDQYFTNSTYKDVLFGSGAQVVRFGFSIGANGGNTAEYLDWAKTSLLNGGDTIDFVGPSTRVLSDTPVAVPLPTSAAMGSVLLAVAGGGAAMWRRRRIAQG